MTFIPPTNDEELVRLVVSRLRSGKLDSSVNAIGDAVSFARGKLIGDMVSRLALGLIGDRNPLFQPPIFPKLPDDGRDSEASEPTE